MKHTCNAAIGSLRCRACAAGLPPDPPSPEMRKLLDQIDPVAEQRANARKVSGIGGSR